VQEVFQAGIIRPLINLLEIGEFEIKKEAVWAISNATSGGNHDQIKYNKSHCFCLFLVFFSVILVIEPLISLQVSREPRLHQTPV